MAKYIKGEATHLEKVKVFLGIIKIIVLIDNGNLKRQL